MKNRGVINNFPVFFYCYFLYNYFLVILLSSLYFHTSFKSSFPFHFRNTFSFF